MNGCSFRLHPLTEHLTKGMGHPPGGRSRTRAPRTSRGHRAIQVNCQASGPPLFYPLLRGTPWLTRGPFRLPEPEISNQRYLRFSFFASTRGTSNVAGVIVPSRQPGNDTVILALPVP